MKSRARITFDATHTAFETESHVHTWAVTALFTCPEDRLLRDGREVQAILRDICGPLAAHPLEDTLASPTNEGMAEWVAERLKERGLFPIAVDVWRETEGLGATWP